MKSKTLVRLAAAIALTASASAQITYQGPLTGNTEWTNGTNWVGGIFPDATDATARFTNTSATNSWSADTITLGSIVASNTSGNVVIGNGSTNTDVLELATTTGTPTIFVNTGAILFNYATTAGSQGFTKTGGGNLTFRFNTVDNTFEGNVNFNAGTLTVNQDGSLGNANNDIIVNSDGVSRTNTLAFSPGNNAGTVTLNANRSITISNGLLQVNTTSNAISGAINGAISGPGALTFVGPSTGTNASAATSYTLNGANTYAGQTTIQMGAKVALGLGSAISTNTLSLSGGNGSFARLDLGGNTQSVASITTASSTATARTMVISNGTLNVGSGGAFTLNGINGTTVDMSGLTAFTFNGAAGNRNFTVSPDTVSGSATNTNAVFLAGGSNNISAAAMTIGGATGGSQGGNHQAQLSLGQANQISATTLTLGGFNGSGVVALQNGITNGSLSLRGSNGVSRMGTLIVGASSSGTRSGAGTLNISNGTIDALVTNTYIGIFGANSTGPNTTSLLAMGGGNFDTVNMVMATITNTTITNASASVGAVFQQNGGNVKVQTLTMGQSDAATNVSGPVFLPTYNLSSSNAVLRAQTITAGASTNYGSGTVRKINFGAGTIQNYDAATDLAISGKDTTSSGRIEIAVASNSSSRTFLAEAGRKITIAESAVLTSTGNIVKAGAGTLILNGANTYSGGTAVNEGTLTVNNTTGSATGTGALTVASGAALNGSGIIGGATTVSGFLNPGNSPGDITFNDSLLLDSTATLTIEITGITAGQFDRVVGAGSNTFTFGGTLALNNTGYTAIFGDSIAIFDNWAGFAGSFDNITGTDLGGGLSWDTSNLATTGTIEVVPEPSTYALLALAAAGLGARVIRRRNRR